jgi:tetratricopeptide (TPR) repeat protein
MQSLRLSATEGFVLSRIDGRMTVSELASMTGLPASTVRQVLDKLESLKVIIFLSRPPPPITLKRSPSQPSRPASSGGPASTGTPARAPGAILTPTGSPQSGQTPAPSAPSADANAATEPTAPKDSSIAARIRTAMTTVSRDAPELLEDVDLDRDLRMRILATSAVLDGLDYYEILGVGRNVDKKAIKRAYFEIAALFHPDRYFRKQIGSFKIKMETLFGRATQALDTLSNRELRAGYDAYLVDLDRTRAIEDLMRDAAAEAQRAEEDAVRSARRVSVPEITADPNPAPPSSAHPVTLPPQVKPRTSGLYSVPQTTPPAPRESAAPTAPVVSDQARRDALALRLLGNRSLPPRGSGAPSPSSRSSPPVARVSVSGGGDDALKRRYDERIELARKVQATKYLGLAHEAESKKDVVGAASAYRVLLKFLEAGDPTVEVANLAIRAADEVLVETYLRQAKYEDQSEHWIDSARSWQKVVRTRPGDALAHERAAHALARSQGDLHLAAELGTRACGMEPENFEFKITLAVVYLEAGLYRNARRELEAAQQLSPRNAKIQGLLKRAKAG